MIQLTVKDIAKLTGGKIFSRNEEALVKGFSIDTRTLKEGEFYVAIEGVNYDGHDFLEEALNRGAAGVIAKESSGDISGPSLGQVIRVSDTKRALSRIAAYVRRHCDVPVVAITGTNGKTTVKDILSHILSSKYKVLSSKKSYNNVIGVSLTLLEMDPSYDVAVVEIGTNHPGEISELARMAEPNAAVITNIGDGHLEAFVNREGVFIEKISLLDFLTEDGAVFLNKDDFLLSRAAVHDVTRKFYGTTPGSDLLITDISRKDGCYTFLLNGEEYDLPLEGEHNISNAAAAISVAQHFGVNHDEIYERLKTVKLPGMRLERVRAEGITFINDSYNSNPDSFESALKVLQNEGLGVRKAVIAGDMLELGKFTNEFHRMIGRSIANKGIDYLITLGKNAKHIAAGAFESGMDKDKTYCTLDHEDAARMIREMAGPETVVLIKGSRAARMEDILKCFTTSCTP